MSRETMRGLERGLSVLRALERTDGLALRDLHRETQLPKPTLLRILSTLEENGYARRRITDGSWRRAARRSETPQSLMHDLLLDVGGEVLDDLCSRIAWPSDLAVYHRGMMHILETTRRKTPFAVNMTGIGYRVPMLQTGLGRAWLAFSAEADREKIVTELCRSENPFDRAAREPEAVAAIVEETRRKGYGTRVPGFTLRAAGEDKTNGVAVPVMMRGRVIACISLVWTISALNEQTVVKRYLAKVQAAASRVGYEIEKRLPANAD
jgi:IclR family mhp operon transcriptional activator